VGLARPWRPAWPWNSPENYLHDGKKKEKPEAKRTIIFFLMVCCREGKRRGGGLLTSLVHLVYSSYSRNELTELFWEVRKFHMCERVCVRVWEEDAKEKMLM